MHIITRATIGLVAGATTLAAAAPAQAQRYYDDRPRGGDVATAAIIGGVAGLAIGAAIAGDNRRNWRGYDRRYYGPRHRGNFYGPRYAYAPRYAYNPRRAYRRNCIGRQFDPYSGRSFRVRYC
ncbi:hypothetical protein [Sphingomonas sp. 37zxx]|uniref:hypothetical protein n=1 Tax=Sphingomonas sp. 37zxx TaxID=1550073 RepID=UPI00053BFC7E|nr:hypothetical protein [Sphingomonas sp. 37zxx]